MPAVICQGSYAGLYMLNAMCYVSNLICQLQYVCIYMSAHECLIFPISCQVSLYANLDCFMSNYYISVCMPNALCHILYAECNGLYAKLHMLDCYMPNTMTIAMSFSMTTEQVGYLNIYMSITRLWLSILPVHRRNYYYITMASVYISALRYISLLAHQVIKWYLESQEF
jgi:hypothetical protein